MKRHHIAVPLFFLAQITSDAPTARAQDPVAATALVDTGDAIWFSTEAEPDLVFYIGRTHTRVDEFSGSTGRRRFRVEELMHAVEIPSDLSSLNELWSQRIAQPYAIVPAESCTLQTRPEMVLIAQQSDMLGRSIAANQTAPICQFSFNLARDVDEGVVSALQQQASDGTLIVAPLAFELRVGLSVRREELWSRLAADSGVRDVLFRKSQADALIAWAITQVDEIVEAYENLSDAERDALIADARAHLFRRVNGRYLLVDTAPEGEFSLATVVQTIQL